jgi:hypothetical protein
MAKKYVRKKPYGKTILMGLIVVTIYVLLISNQGLVNDYVSRGGLYAFLPILAAFIVSFFHGSFTGNFWTILGVEAKKKKEVK